MNNFSERVFKPLLTQAGLRRIRFHDLRHTFGSLLIQADASLAYMRDQMGHSSIQVAVDIYGHLIPGANVSFVDRLDGLTSPQQPATKLQERIGRFRASPRESLAGRQGLEPRYADPESAVLPLDDLPDSVLFYHRLAQWRWKGAWITHLTR